MLSSGTSVGLNIAEAASLTRTMLPAMLSVQSLRKKPCAMLALKALYKCL